MLHLKRKIKERIESQNYLPIIIQSEFKNKDLKSEKEPTKDWNNDLSRIVIIYF